MSQSNTPGRLARKIAVVTGGASGVGRGICLAFAKEGATVVVADLQEASSAPDERELTTVEAVKKAHSERTCVWMRCDVTKAADVDGVVQQTVAQFGRLDVMVNNAGISIESQHAEPIHKFARDDLLDRTLDVNVKGVFYGLRAAGAQMVAQEPFDEQGTRGWIINIASIFGLVGTPTAACYVASKHAVMGLTRAASLENAPHRIHVNAICPGFLHTSLIASRVEAEPELFAQAAALHPWGGGGLGAPRDVAGVAVFLASEDARWMTGAPVVVDGGYTAM